MRTATLVLLVTLIWTPDAEAQQPVGSMETLLSRVKSGDTVYVTDSMARETTGTFVKLADGTLTVLAGGQLRDMPTLDVRQVSRHGDSVWNGFLIGAAIGVALGAVGGAMQNDYAVSITANTLMFGGISALIDHFIDGRTVVYRAGPRPTVRIAPMLLPHQHGIQISTTWTVGK
jgi:hypothetical protein